MSDQNVPQQPLPWEGEHWDTTPLELSHVSNALHNIWLRAISIVWNDEINNRPWGKNSDNEWVQITDSNKDIEPIYSTFEDFLIDEPALALGQFGFTNPDGKDREIQPKSLPALKIIRYSDLGQTKELLGRHELNEDIEYEFKVGVNGWFSRSHTAPAQIMPQLTLIIPPKPTNEADQGMALVDYQLAGLSYPFTTCA